MKTFTKTQVLKTLSVLSLALTASSALAADLFDDYRFATAEAAYRAAKALPTLTHDVVGKYKMIATASKSYKGEFQKKDIGGIKNQDSSILEVSLEKAADDSISVRQFNLGLRGQDQGPATAVFDPALGAMSFAQYSYRAGRVTDDVYFLSECRQQDERRLLCAKRFIANKPEVLRPEQRALHEQIIGYDLYTR